MKHRVDICTESQDNIVSVGVHDLPWENLVLLENLLDFTISAVSSFSAAIATYKFLLGTLYNVREFYKR